MAKKNDEIRFGPQIAPDTCIAVRRDADGNEHKVIAGPLEDGASIMPGTEILSVSSECRDGWHEVRPIYKPPQVATPAYRKGYDRIFGKKPNVGLA
ncbi:hypothetical protein LCGC14_2654970 [marine sediment metagenome]|uniref:Uncharacterized protein n=1 Tax=marine sediment metagenome TaxID=412755 RepID=A0A0F9AFY8_9ZZZZ